MATYTVKVKWGKKKLEGVEVNMEESPLVFKSQLFTLTGVPPERQKVMIGGTTLGDEEWGKCASKIKPNAVLMLMGSADVLPQAPVVQQKFIEDMTDAEAMTALKIPVGLQNFGNTCYMNATLQCLKAVPELKDQLRLFRGGDSQYVSKQLTANLSSLYSSMESGQSPDLQLLVFLNSLHTAVPHFGEKDERGVYRQQDAHECWSAIFSNLSESFQSSKFMEKYFGVTFNTSYKCLESSDEMETSETEKGFQLSCFIGQDIKYLHTGIGKGLQGEMEKKSPSLDRDAMYRKTSTITRLPSYLTIQFIRFHVGRAGASEEIVSKKILKDIQFPIINLDMYDFCSPELQQRLLPARRRFKEVEDAKLAEKAKKIAEGPAALKSSKDDRQPVEYEPSSFEDDPGSNNNGYYELKAVLTHKGRSSNSGHYLGWVRRPSGDWIKYDDDDVSLVTEDDIKKLSGGGDWHIAYILLYASKQVEKLPQVPKEADIKKETA